MVTMFSRHTLPDVETWRRAAADFAPVYKKYGIVRTTCYRSVDDPNDITVAHEFETVEAARRFADSDELHQARPKAGVAGEPTVWIATPFSLTD